MSKKILQLNEEVIKSEIKELVRGSVEETLNELLQRSSHRRPDTSAAKPVRVIAVVTITETLLPPPGK